MVMLSPELPAVDPRRCTGCEDCVAVCPTHCLEMAGAQPMLIRPRDCIACAACEMVCPADAIRMETVSLKTQV